MNNQLLRAGKWGLILTASFISSSFVSGTAWADSNEFTGFEREAAVSSTFSSTLLNNSTTEQDFLRGAGNAFQLLPSGSASDDEVGQAIAIDGNHLLLGATGDDDQASNSGAVYVYEFDGANWVQRSKLVIPTSVASDRFGTSISLEGTRAIIGAPNLSGSSENGSAYVFDFDGSDWNLTATLTAQDGTAGDRFGAAVSLDGDRVLIGADSDDAQGGVAGSAYIFELQGGSWTEVAKLTAFDVNPISQLGFSVSLDGDIALVGAPGDNTNGIVSGAAYLFTDLGGGAWFQVGKLLASNGAQGDGLGVSVSLDNGMAAIGAMGGGDSGEGAVYIYSVSVGSANQLDIVSPQGLEAGASFGETVTLVGNRFLAGAPSADGNATSSGSAYVFEFDGSDWLESALITPTETATGDRFGHSVDLSGAVVAVGANTLNGLGTNSGAGFVFQESVDIALSSSGIPGTAIAGNDVTYQLTVTNNGPSAATNVMVDNIVTPATMVSSSTAACTGGFPCNVGSLAAGESSVVMVTVRIPQDASSAVLIDADASSDQADSTAGNESVDAAILVDSVADLQLSASGPSGANPGEMISYQLRVQQLGPSQASRSNLTVNADADLVFVSADGPCSGGFPCDLGAIDSGADITINANYMVQAAASGTLNFNADVGSSTTDPVPGNNSDSVSTTVGVFIDLAVQMTGPDTLLAGENITYQITASNISALDSPAATLDIPVVAGLSFVSADAPCAAGFPCDLGVLSAGSDTVINAIFALADDASGSLNTTANISTTVTDPVPANNSDSVSTTIGAEADLMLIVTAPDEVVAGASFDVAVFYENTGPSQSTGVQLSNLGLSGATFVTADGPCGGGFPCVLGDLSSGASGTVMVTYSVSSDYTGDVEMDFNITGNTLDPALGNNSGGFTLTAEVVHDLVLEKRSFTAHVEDGDLTSYSITISNQGPSDAVDAQVLDVIPASLTGTFWSCLEDVPDLATCPDNGVGDVDALVSIRNSGSVTFTVSANVSSSTEGELIINRAMVVPAAGGIDPVPQNNSDDDVDITALFADSMEDGI
jgi:uncharacterized repeat protein (TIGR01451 family)